MLEINFTPFPTLTTDRLILRQMTDADGEVMQFMRSDPGVMKYIKRPPTKTLEEAIAFIQRINLAVANNESVMWAITLKGDDTLIGNMCLWRIQPDNYRAEIGYALHPAHQGEGIMTEAVNAAVDYAFNTMGLHSLEGQMDPANTASARVLEKAGFVREGYFKENFFYEGSFYDSAVYSLIAPAR